MERPSPHVCKFFALRVTALVVLCLVPWGVLLGLVPAFRQAFPQPLYYHNFADQRCLLHIPHALNVVSNLPFVLVGLWGLWWLAGGAARQGVAFLHASERREYLVFFAFILLTGFGSAHYHSAPDNNTLVWDRMPLAVAFMAFFAITIGERIDTRLGRLLFGPLLLLGAGSVWYWHLTEVHGRGDLRPYLLVQFFPLVAIPLMLLLFPPRYTRTADLWGALAFYLAAKALEALDQEVYSYGSIVSGHTLKHLLAAVTPLLMLHMLRRRRPAPARAVQSGVPASMEAG
jgi:hypothetical protein